VTQTSLRARVTEVAKAALVFSFFGPVVGLIIFTVGYFTFESGPFTAVVGALLLFFLPPFVGFSALPFAYYMGVIPALVSGLFLGLYAAVKGSPHWPIVLASGLAAGLFQVLFIGVGDLPSPRYLIVSRLDPLLGVKMLTLATCIAATMICWGGLRMWNSKVTDVVTNPKAEN